MRDDAAVLEAQVARTVHVYPVGRDDSSDAALRTLAAADSPHMVVERRIDCGGWLVAAAGAVPGCVLLDSAGAEVGDLLHQVAATKARHATIVLTDNDGATIAVAAMRAGAVDVLRKPVAPAELARAVREALAGLRQRTERLMRSDKAKSAVERLSPRERAVMAGLVEGLSTNAISDRLNVSVRTVAGDRARVMRGTESAGVVDLMRCALAAGMLVEG